MIKQFFLSLHFNL